MELLAPSNMLLAWQIMVITTIILFIVALTHLLTNKSASPLDKIYWALVILFVPLIGSVLYILIGVIFKRKMDF
jgi:hypothetical protein